MVKSTVAPLSGTGGVTTYYPSASYEKKNGVVTKYYGNGVTRARQGMRVGGDVYYTLGNHLGSTSVTVNGSGTKVAEMHYTPWGEVRNGNIDDMQTDRTYTGQRTYADNFGLMYYNARWYDPEIGRFAQADTVVPGGVQGLDRYAYTGNNPVNFDDPTGHKRVCHAEYQGGQTIQMCSGSDQTIDEQLADYGVTLTGDMLSWTDARKLAVLQAVALVGVRLASKGESGADAFKRVYKAVHFQWGGCGDDCRKFVWKTRKVKGKKEPEMYKEYYGEEGGALASGWQSNDGDGYFLIKIATMVDDGGSRGQKQMVHELGHTYDYANGKTSGTTPSFFTRGVLHPNGYYNADGSFVVDDARLLWQMHPASMSGGEAVRELYADAFLAWVYKVWNPSTDPEVRNNVKQAKSWVMP